MTAGTDLRDIHDVLFFMTCPSVCGWAITRTVKELVVLESFTSQEISFGWTRCCDQNVADDFLLSCHHFGFVTNGPSEWLNQTRGRWTSRRGHDKSQKTPIKPETSRIQNGRYLPSKISPNRYNQTMRNRRYFVCPQPPISSPVNFGPEHNQEYINRKV